MRNIDSPKNLGAAAIVVSLLFPSFAWSQYDVPFVPTPEPVVDAMLELAEVSEDDYVIDLGSGDGRIVIAAAKEHGARGLGVDIDPERVEEGRRNADAAGVADRVQFVERDLFETDLSQATVLTLYLLQGVNLRLRDKILTEMRPGSRIVSHAFDMGDWEPSRTMEVDGKRIYLWVVPEEPEEISDVR